MDQVTAERRSRPVGQWNLFEVSALEAMIAVKLNGEEVAKFENASELRGHIGLQNHHEGSAVQFRALRLQNT